MTKRIHAVISGHVQNVGFRIFVRRRAMDLGLTGWVANLADPNTLELEVEGNDQAIASMEQAIRRGPPGARVRDVSITPISPENRSGGGFEVR